MQELPVNTDHYQREMEEMASIVSHDLQEPLRMVICFTELLEKRYGQFLDADGHEYVRYANDGAKRMRSMLDDLREYTRITTRGTELVPTDSQSVLRQVIQLLDSKIQQLGADLAVLGKMPMVMADQKQLYILFKQLLDNALKFYPRERKPEIQIGAEEQGRFLRFFVRDKGVTIDSRYHQQIFRVFSTLHAKNEFAGTGMGLAICKKIIERHGGQIGVNNLKEGGKEFYFTLKRPEDN